MREEVCVRVSAGPAGMGMCGMLWAGALMGGTFAKVNWGLGSHVLRHVYGVGPGPQEVEALAAFAVL